MKVLFDTSVWIEHLRRDVLADITPALRGRYAPMMDSVAIAELLGGCRSKRERTIVEKLCAPFERADRVLTPTHADYRRAATALSRLRQSGKTLKNPGAALLDSLVAATAAREGALLVTLNVGDFEKLGAALPVRWQAFESFRKSLGAG